MERRLAGEGDSLILAVSGGRDSMVLLDLFARLSGKMKLKLRVAHTNHLLRGRASDADEDLVRGACERLGLAFELKRARPKPGANLEDCARRIRYAFLCELAKKSGASAVATAHHQLDQAETILSHMLRGSGLAGLRGMACSSRIGGVKIIRPLIFAPRAEIDRYASARRIQFHDDATNAETRYSRNAIRHRLIPVLEELSPSAVKLVAKMGERLAADDDALRAISREIFSDIHVSTLNDGVRLKRPAYAGLPRALRIRLLSRAYELAAGTRADLNSDQLGKMDEISLGVRPRASYHLKSPLKFIRGRDIISIVRSTSKCDRPR